jgi:SP family general alpha glucoside:H+ symporter-like MFS transporter
MTVAQAGWAIPAEVSATRLRLKTICVSRNFYYITSIACNALQLYFMNSTQ